MSELLRSQQQVLVVGLERLMATPLPAIGVRKARSRPSAKLPHPLGWSLLVPAHRPPLRNGAPFYWVAVLPR